MKKGIISVLSFSAGAAGGLFFGKKTSNASIKEKEKKIDRLRLYYNVLLEWLQKKQDGKNLEDYFIEKEYKTVAIYGMGELGLRLADELKDSSIELKYGIDKNASSVYSDLELKDPDDSFDDVDVIVVTPIFAFDDIENELSSKVNCPIISLEEVVSNLS